GYFRVMWWEGEIGNRRRREKIFPRRLYKELESAEEAARKFADSINQKLAASRETASPVIDIDMEQTPSTLSTSSIPDPQSPLLLRSSHTLSTEERMGMLEWYPGMAIPLGNRGRDALRKALNKKRNQNSEKCDRLLSEYNLSVPKNSSFGYFTLSKLLHAAKLLDLWPLARSFCFQFCQKAGFHVEWIAEMRNKGVPATFQNLQQRRKREIHSKVRQKKAFLSQTPAVSRPDLPSHISKESFQSPPYGLSKATSSHTEAAPSGLCTATKWGASISTADTKAISPYPCRSSTASTGASNSAFPFSSFATTFTRASDSTVSFQSLTPPFEEFHDWTNLAEGAVQEQLKPFVFPGIAHFGCNLSV
ncbi:hypothetical protein IE077_002074, partial [Cardiosporidium cionae]